MKQLSRVGDHGATVAIFDDDGRIIFRYTDPKTGRRRQVSTRHRSLPKARPDALTLAAQIRIMRDDLRDSGGPITWLRLLAWYEIHREPTMTPAQQRRDAFARKLWSHVLPLNEPVPLLDPIVLERFKKDRREGNLLDLAPASPRTVGADLQWLRRVCNHAIKAPGVSLVRNPIVTEIPDTPRPLRPVATWDRYEQLRPYCDEVGSQGLLGGFFDLVVALGWRVTAICSLHCEDIDLRPFPNCPDGRVRKRAEYDKEGVEAWVPIPAWLAPRLLDLVNRRRALVVPGPWLFPRVKDPTKPWHKDYASYRLASVERLAGLEPLEGGVWHPYRRMWATLRKGLPVGDVAHAGGWKSVEMVHRYQGVDAETLNRVMNAGFPAPRPDPPVGEPETGGSELLTD